MSRQAPLVFIMAAGLGTRMKSDMAKVLHKVAGRPLLHGVGTAARTANAARVVAILGHQIDTVKASLEASFGAGAVDLARQTEHRGAGHAVECALPAAEAGPVRNVVFHAANAALRGKTTIGDHVLVVLGSVSTDATVAAATVV